VQLREDRTGVDAGCLVVLGRLVLVELGTVGQAARSVRGW
jgi:hypothetical protein